MAGPAQQKPGQPSGSRPGTGGSEMNTGAGASAGPESSKFKRFLKRFGRRTSDDAVPSPGANGRSTTNGVNGQHEEEPSNGHNGLSSPDQHAIDGLPSTNGNGNGVSNGNGSKKGSAGRQSKRTGSKSAKRSDSLLSGRFFQSTSSTPPVPATQRQQPEFSTKGDAAGASTGAPQSSSPKQLNGKSLGAAEAGQAQAANGDSATEKVTATQIPASQTGRDTAKNDQLSGATGKQTTSPAKTTRTTQAVPTAAGPGVLASAMGVTNVIAQEKGDSALGEHHAAESPRSSFVSHQSGQLVSSDNESQLRRNSVDNATVNTTKSRASTKPTTLMSLDTRDNFHGTTYAPIAQFTSSPDGAQRSGPRVSEGGSVQFSNAPPMARSASGTIVALPGQSDPPEETPYTNVPSTTRPHPSNNPHPSNIPADNASVLTLASSNAAASILGGAASSRGHSQATQSMGGGGAGGGGARSIGGSYMGERRNSSDTYASVKALPPLSRRGSDSSQRTGRSIAASATGQNSHQAMTHGAPSFVASTGPGAPPDRISIHRTASQRTIATQLSIPLSTSNQALGSTGPVSGDDVMTTTHGSANGARRASGQGLMGSSEALLGAGNVVPEANGVDEIAKTHVPSKDNIPAPA